jgi:hypothetical protein
VQETINGEFEIGCIHPCTVHHRQNTAIGSI